MKLEELEIENDVEASRFELKVEGHIAYIEYMTNKAEKIFLMHTVVPEELKGKGVGGAMVKKTLEYIKSSGKKLVPQCTFVQNYVRNHEEYKEILAPGINI